MTTRSGNCLCGKIRYEVTGEPRASTVCHCSHCKKQSGSILSVNFVFRETDFHLSGEPKLFVDSGDSGSAVNRYFCGDCGSPIFATIASMPGKVVVKAGSLNVIGDAGPQAEIYAQQRVGWLPEIAGTRQFACGFE